MILNLSILPIEGGEIESLPLVNVYQANIDDQLFQYIEYKGDIFLILSEVYQDFAVINPTDCAKKFHKKYKPLFPNSFGKFRVSTPGGIQEKICGTFDVVNVLCFRIKKLTPKAIDYLRKISLFQKEIFEGKTALIPVERQAYLNNKIQDGYNFLSSEVKFLHKKQNISCTDITNLAEAVKQIQTQMDAEIDAEIDAKTNARIDCYQVDVIHDLVQKELAVVVAEKRGLTKPTSQTYRECWLDFNKHFNIATYRNLPASKFENAKKYLLYKIEQVSKEEPL